ncbi:telomere binding protein [Serendipita sp. 399]|nr:telomere binding protein [Serendipita sp. 399]
MSHSDTLRSSLTRLRAPIGDQDELISTLSIPAELLGLVATAVQQETTRSAIRFVSEYQYTLVQHVIPHWEDKLRESGQLHLFQAFFLPSDLSLNAATPSDYIRIYCIISSHSSLIRRPISQFAIDTLEELCKIYPIHRVFEYLFTRRYKELMKENADELWTDYLTSLFSIPGRLGNATSDGKLRLPAALEIKHFLETLCNHFYKLITNPSFNSCHDDQNESVANFLDRLSSQGCFPTTSAHANLVSFWGIVLPLLQQDLRKRPSLGVKSGISRFPLLLTHLPVMQQMGIVHSLLGSFNLLHPGETEKRDVGIDATPQTRSIIKRESTILETILGELFAQNSGDPDKEASSGTWPIISNLLDKGLTEGISRVIVCWAAATKNRATVFRSLLARATEIWTNEDHIKHSTLDRHRFVTCFLLTIVANLRVEASSPYSGEFSEILKSLSRQSSFINAVGIYIGHLDASVRRCGLLVAEVCSLSSKRILVDLPRVDQQTVAGLTGGKLHFGDWEGIGDGREWAREMRVLMEGKDADAEFELGHEESDTPALEPQDISQRMTDSASAEKGSISVEKVRRVLIVDNGNDSDDSLDGYGSDSSSSPDPYPTDGDRTPHRQSEPTIEEINADPTLLNPSKKKIHRPVYILDLAKLFKVPKEGDEQAESIRIGLDSAAALIRKKAGWGTELEENAVDLTCSIIVLQNNYDLESFDQLVLEALTALVACCPKKVAPESIAREESSSRFSRSGGFKATGTGLILNPLILSHFVHTMSIMTHASRHSPAYLSIIAPAVLELAVTLGTRRMGIGSSGTVDQESKRVAAVLSACLELAIVVLDASIDLDEGKTLALEHGPLMFGVSTWSQSTYKLVESGLKFEGVGGEIERRLGKASTGLVLKVEEVVRLATVVELVKNGGFVSVLDLKELPEHIHQTLPGAQILYVKTDLTEDKQIEAAVNQTIEWIKETGAKLGGVVNCGGVAVAQKARALMLAHLGLSDSLQVVSADGTPHSLDLFEFALKVNVTGTFNLTRRVLEHLVKAEPEGADKERGIIIMVASAAAFEGQQGQVAYAASKGAIRSMTLPMARDLGRFGVRVNTIAPSLIISPMTNNMSEKVKNSLQREIVFPKRFGEPEEFAHTARFLIESTYMNGETVRLSAGGRMPGRL